MDVADLRKKSIEELNEELVALRMQQATGELSHNHEHGRVRKDIARIKTVLNELQRSAGE